MSTAAVSSLSILQELQSFYQHRQADLKQIGSALQGGDLAGAQQAYKAMATLGENGPYANSEPFSKAGRAQAFDAIGEVLQAGDLARAQAGFATLTAKASNSTTSAQTSAAIVISREHTAQHRIAHHQQYVYDLPAIASLPAAAQADLAQLGQALQSGDLAGAQAAFANLASSFGKQSQQAQTAISAYNRVAAEIVINFIGPPISKPPAAQGPPKEPPVFQPPSGSTNSTGLNNVPEVVINLGSTSGSTTPELIVNLEPGKNSSSGAAEIVINLGGASSAGASNASTAPEIVVDLGQGNGTSSASAEQIQINLGNSGAGGQITIDENPGKNGNADQVTISLNRQKTNNYELILNVLAATSQTQSISSNALSVSA